MEGGGEGEGEVGDEGEEMWREEEGRGGRAALRRVRLGLADAYFLPGAHVAEGSVAAHGLYVSKHFKVASGVC